MDTDSVMVSMIQYLLRSHGYYVIVDGDFGIRTQQQIRAFQRHNGLYATGTVNGKTWEKLIVPLHRGSHGDAVRAAQVALQQASEKLPIDGLYGLQTEQAVKALQKADRLKVDGLIGPETWLDLTDPVPD
jgi:peptidoglycan hydrolase-like protein with peptidoglycan-binding domain